MIKKNAHVNDCFDRLRRTIMIIGFEKWVTKFYKRSKIEQ